jgi:hypothetical protein
MIILWIRRRKTGEKKGETEEKQKHFAKHDEDMKRFKLAHSDMNIMSGDDILTDEGDILAPVNKVKLSTYVAN